MINIFAECRSEVTLTQDEQPVEKLGPCRFDPPLGDGIRFGCSDRSLDDFDSVFSKYLIERGGEPRVSVVDKEAKVVPVSANADDCSGVRAQESARKAEQPNGQATLAGRPTQSAASGRARRNAGPGHREGRRAGGGIRLHSADGL
jgi:hypothetical protein